MLQLYFSVALKHLQHVLFCTLFLRHSVVKIESSWLHLNQWQNNNLFQQKNIISTGNKFFLLET